MDAHIDINYDKKTAIQNLKNSGLTQSQAEAVVEEQIIALNQNLATKEDIEALTKLVEANQQDIETLTKLAEANQQDIEALTKLAETNQQDIETLTKNVEKLKLENEVQHLKTLTRIESSGKANLQWTVLMLIAFAMLLSSFM